MITSQPQQTQPQQTQPQQPPQQAQAYSSEPSMENHIEVGSQTVSVTLDPEALKIIQQASQLNGETIINLGIKMFAKTNVYKEFMLKAEFKTLDVVTEDIVDAIDLTPNIVTAAPQVLTKSSSQVSNTPAASNVAAAATFNSW